MLVSLIYSSYGGLDKISHLDAIIGIYPNFSTMRARGVKYNDPNKAKQNYIEALEDLAPKFGLKQCCAAISPSELYRELGPSKTIKLSDALLKQVQDQIETAYFSYVILPPAETPTIKVGGYSSPLTELTTFSFLKRLSVYYSYITAWSYQAIEERRQDQLILDGFRGPRTYAWEDITSNNKPQIYSHGDECNPLISIADIIAFLTDKKLYAAYKHLEPQSIEDVWTDYNFEKEVHYLTQNILSKIRWYTEDTIDITEYYVHPTVFLYSRARGLLVSHWLVTRLTQRL
jgi:hypothetical protein